MSDNFGSGFVASPKLSRAAEISCGFSARQSDNATSKTSVKWKENYSFHPDLAIDGHFVIDELPKTFFCNAGDIRPLAPSVSKNVVNR